MLPVSVREDQRHFLDATESVLYAVAEGQFHPTFPVYAVMVDATVVGFVCCGFLPEDDTIGWIPLIIIDKARQGRGYGRAAMESMIALMSENPACRAIGLNYVPANTVAARLYASLGFLPQEVAEGLDSSVRIPAAANPHGAVCVMRLRSA
ncbi:MAG: GNAT family N-acetyltransferase [Candidatus Dormibacteraceae bacterium]